MTRLGDIEARLRRDLKARLPEEGADSEDVWLAGVASDVRYLLTIVRAAERYCTLPDGHEELQESYYALRAALETTE